MQQKFLKRWLICMLFSGIFITVHAQSLKKVEYFFDTDPGVGNGIALTISSSPSIIDSTFTFDVSSLLNGLHTIYIRAQDDSLHWSLNYSTSFIKTSGSGGPVMLSRLEYFFDTDPGVGKGANLNISPTGMVDSTFSFDVSGLTDGLHIIYVRAIDANDNKSLNYSTSFIKKPGDDSLLTITKLEYFLDTDPGFGNGTALPIQQANIINDTFKFKIPDNGADARTIYVRAKDSHGQWSLLYEHTVDLCDLYKAKPNFSWVRFSDLYSFIDSSENNYSHKLLWNFDNLGVDSVSNPQFTFPQGNHFVKLVAGTGCRKDSVVLPLFTGLEKYYPDTALAGGDVFINFYGGGLDTNVIVTLKNGSANINPYGKVAYQQQFFTGVFDLHSAAPGLYDINLHFPNGYDTTIAGGLQLAALPAGTNNYSPELSLQVTGPMVARAGTIVTQHLIITNIGGMVAKSVPVWSASLNTSGYSAGPGFKTYFEPDHKLDYHDSVPTEEGLDSLLGEPYQGKLHNFMIPALNSGQSFSYSYTLQAPAVHGEIAYVDFWAGDRMFGSPFEWDCIHAALDNGFNLAGLIPIVGCGFGVAGFGVDFLSGIAGQFGWNSDRSYDNFGSVKPGSFIYGAASAAWGCIPGVKTAEEASKIALATVKIVNGSKKAADVGKAGFDYNTGDPCDDKNDPLKSYRKTIRGQVASDPNGINGPSGYGDNNYISGIGKQGYEVFFENLPTATANAQRITVVDTLDKAKFDLSSFELVGFNLADSFFHIPYQRQEFTTTMDLRPGMNLQLRVNARLDTATGILNFTFLSLDPDTRDTIPLSDLRGFLPPDVNDLNGRGSILYVVNYKKKISTNDVVTNRASIVFDNNAPIITNTWLNTIDRTAPTGGVTSGTKTNDSTVLLTVGGSDIGVGIQRYKVYVRENNKPFIYLGFVATDTVRFTGRLDSSYSFYAIPFDSVHNATFKSPAADYMISFTSSLPVTLARFYGQHIDTKNYLYFQVKEMSNVNRVVIERSADGRSFGEVGYMLSSVIKLNDINEYTDGSPLTGNNYYRLKILDYDGQYKYSNVILLRSSAVREITMYPNPVKQNLEVKVNGMVPARLMITVTDAAGKLVFNDSREAPAGSSQFTLPFRNLSSGIYFIHIKDAAGNMVFNQKFMKE